MSEHQKQTIIRWFEEVWNKGRRQAIDEMLGRRRSIFFGAIFQPEADS